MAKKQKRAQMKYVQMAAELKVAQRNKLIQLIACVIIGIALWVWLSFSGINDHSIVASVLIFGGTVIVVFLIGLVGNKFASYGTELRKIKNEYGVTDDQIKEWRAKH